MNAAVLERDQFAPQKPPGMRSGLALALVAHALLIVALAWSVHWKSSEPEGVVAELWASVPQTAAPRAAAPEPKPTPPPEPKPEPKPEPPPVAATPPPAPVAKPAPPPPVRVDPQIAIEREKAREREREREKAREEELERAAAAKKAELKKREEAKRLEAERERERERERLAAEQAEKKKLAEQAEKKRLAEQAKKDEARQAAIREANLRRMMKEAGSSDDPAAAGNAARTAGPSSGYAGRIKARIKPNIVLASSLDGNPAATVEVRVAPDGTIVGRKLVKSSGSSLWDETVLRAIDKTEVLPKDVDGRVPPTIEIAFRPRD
jgi:colicin import membrane protein